MAEILGKDLDLYDDSMVAEKPFNLAESDITGPRFITGEDLARSTRISKEWKDPVAIPSQASVPYMKAVQPLVVGTRALVDSIANIMPNMANAIAQTSLEVMEGEEKKPELTDSIDTLNTITKPLVKILGVGLWAADIDRKELMERAKTYDEAISLLESRDYPSHNIARRVIANTTADVESRRAVRELYRQAGNIDSSKWYNKAGEIIGAMVPALIVGKGAFGTARAFGAGRLAASRIAQNVAKGYIGVEMGGQYAEETAAQYLERTGDKKFENFTASDATGITAMAYGAIGAQIEMMGGVEPIFAGALNKVGLKSGLLKAGAKIGAGEATEELLQGLTETLMRKIDGSSNKTWREGFMDSLNSAVWGLFIGGSLGTASFHVGRANLVKGIKQALPNITDTQAGEIANVMIDNTAEVSSQDPALRTNLRQKVALMYRDIDIENKEDIIDATTDLEYGLIAMDSAERGVDIAENPIFAGEVNELGWFRDAIPENRRKEITALNDEIKGLKDQLAEEQKKEEKNWEKIDELESKLSQVNEYVLDKLSDLARNDAMAVRRMLRETEQKFVNKEKEKSTKKAIQGGNVDIIGNILSKAGFKTRDLSGTQIKKLAKMNWELLQDQNLGVAQSRGTTQVPLANIERNVESGNAVLLRAGYTQDQIDKMDDETWNRAILTQYRKESPAQPEYTEEDIASWEGVEFQEQFDLADENARLDDIYPEYTGETIEVDGKERSVYNSNGDRIAKSKEALTNFWRWFGDSKVVDKKGRPLVMHHGTKTEFEEFYRSSDIGFHFGSKGAARIKAGRGKQAVVYNVYLKIQNPLKFDRDLGNWDAAKDSYLATELLNMGIITQEQFNGLRYNFGSYGSSNAILLRNALKEKGFDGIEYPNYYEDTGKISYIAFNSNQIKSVDNRGTYSADTGNIYWQSAEDVKDLVATHAIKLDGIKQALRVGGFAMPSLAIRKDLDNSYGEIIFVAPANMAMPSRTTRVYDRDAWTPMINFIEYKSKDGFYDRVKEILAERGIDPKSASSFVYNIEEKMKEGVAEWNTTAVELFGIDKGYIERGEEDEMRSLINQNADIREEYNKWYEEFILPNMTTRIFRGFTNSGNRRYVPATLENIVKELKEQPEHRDFSWNDTYFFHDVARELVSRFKTLKEIKKASNRLIEGTEVAEKINELSSEYYALAEELKVDESSHNPEILLSLALIEGKGNTAERLEMVGLKHDEESVKKVNAIVKKIKELPTKYFEGKVRRAVRFNEFSAVFVPSGRKYDEVASRLEEQDTNIIRYDSKEDMNKKFEELTQKDQRIMFQNRVSGAGPRDYRGAYIPAYRFIQRANRMDASTLSHELAHDWMEVNFDRFRSGKATPEFMRAWGALEKALGIEENATQVPRKASETFARAYEAWIMTNEDWAKLINIDDKDKGAVEKLLKDYQGELRNIYNDMTSKYFKDTWGKLGELKPELKAWFDRAVNITDLDRLVERGEMTEEQATEERLNRAIDKVIENTTDEETANTLRTARLLNDTARYEVEGGNKNSLQNRLSALAREIDENNTLLKKDRYNTRRDMMQVAEAADNFVKTRLDDALAIINGEMAEVEGLYKEDIYTALERLAIENGDMGLITELKNSEIANRLAKELGQRVAGFRNWKQSDDIDILSALKSTDNIYNKALENKKAKEQFNSALDLFEESLKNQDEKADADLDSTLNDLECK